MLHEEVIIDWNSLQQQIHDPKLLESLQMDFVYGVSCCVHKAQRYFILKNFTWQGVTSYIGRRARTRDVLQRHMYITEITQWLQEAENEERQDINSIIEEAHINARLITA